MESKETPIKKAVALGYDPERDVAPKVVAKGRGLVAERILAIAEEHDIYVKEDQRLIDYLTALDLYHEIPPPLYGIIAEIMSFIYRMDGDFKA